MKKYIDYMKTELGVLQLTIKDDKLISIRYLTNQNKNDIEIQYLKKTELIKEQLKKYLSGQRKKFTVPFKIEGSRLQKDVYTNLLEVKYGQTISYKELAKKSGYPKAYRAVGTALSKNKIPIIIPCHRVIRSDGAMGNYTGGRWIKKILLELEGCEFN